MLAREGSGNAESWQSSRAATGTDEVCKPSNGRENTKIQG
jgi:hypothetical protein